jgi:hypothetical protein
MGMQNIVVTQLGHDSTWTTIRLRWVLWTGPQLIAIINCCCLLTAFSMMAVVNNEWAAWAPPGVQNPNYEQRKSDANFYRACCYSCAAAALGLAVHGYLKRRKPPQATHD